jgi:hypothetical protein
MSMNPRMMEIVAEAKMADLRRAAAKQTGGTRHALEAGISPTLLKARMNVPGTARRSIGWFLVSFGMRLVRSGQHPMSAA